MNKDKIKERFEEVKGKARIVTGKIIGNKKLEIEGEAHKISAILGRLW